MPFATLASTTVHYRDSGQGTAFLLLHASPGDSRDFDAVEPALARSVRVLRLDWPGFGLSPAPSEQALQDCDFHTRVVREFLNHLGIDQAVLIGNSIGGNVAVRFAVASPERVKALVLVSPGGFTHHNVLTRAFCALQASRLSIPPVRWAGRYLRLKTEWTRAMVDRARGEQSGSATIAVARAVWKLFSRPEFDLREQVAHLHLPVLLMFGEMDPVIPAHKDGLVARKLLPHAQFRTLPCGHASFAELPDQFLRELSNFIAL
jgi:pimeloyl-ACP methyl ester carboxylesterase